jgi:hypothetical protein
MRRLLSALAVASILLAGTAVAADVPAYIGKHVTSAEDTQAINKVIDDFQTAIQTKDSKLLSTLVLNSNILFDAPYNGEDITMVRATYDVNFDGLGTGGYVDFSRFIRTAKEPIEEKFYNVKITQDGHVAWVMFDYEFVRAGKTQNYGLETWQMVKVLDKKWKIASVIWTMNHPPR